VPPLPEPSAFAEISPPLMIAIDAAVTATAPALPLLPKSAVELMPVSKVVFDPSIRRFPATFTKMLPPSPLP
jgi:hypothetical protein